jgi:hypothetical protein
VGIYGQKTHVDRALRKLEEPLKRKKWKKPAEQSPVGNERRPKYYA